MHTIGDDPRVHVDLVVSILRPSGLRVYNRANQKSITSSSSFRNLPRPLDLMDVLFAQLQHSAFKPANARSSDSPFPPRITPVLPLDSLL